MKTIYRWILSCGLLSFLFMMSPTCFAVPYSVAPKAGTSLPTSVGSGQTATALYTITNITERTLANSFVKYFPLNVAQVVSDNTYPDLCGATFNLVSGGSCTLELKVSGPVNANDPDPHHHLFVCTANVPACAGTNYPLNVSGQSSAHTLTSITVTPATAIIGVTATQQYTATGNYSDGTTANLTSSVTWQSSNPATATISGSGLATGVAVNTVSITASANGVTSSAVTLQVSGPVAYIANENNNTISICPVNLNGSLQTCTTTNPAGLNGPVDIVVNNAGNKAYILNRGNSTMSICNVNIGGALSNCNIASDPSFGLIYGGITLNANNSLLYISNYNLNTVSICNLNADGSLGSCNAEAGNGDILGPNGRTALVTATTTTPTAYIPNYNGDTSTNNTVGICPITGSTFGTCTATDGGGVITNSVLGLAADVSQTHLYVSNWIGSVVAVCTINANSSLTGCTTSTGPNGSGTATFNFSNDTVTNLFLSNTNYLYAPNGGNNTISICPVNPTTGAIQTCTVNSDPTIDAPQSFWIAFQIPV